MLALLVLSPLVASRSVEKVVGLAGSRVAERRAVSRLLRVWAIALCATADVLEARSVLGGRGRISDGEAMPLDSFFAHSLSSARKMWDNGILYAILNYRLKSNNHLRRQSQGRRWSGIFEAHNLQTFVNKHGRHSEPRSWGFSTAHLDGIGHFLQKNNSCKTKSVGQSMGAFKRI
jgi:hypothetical protein